MDILLALRGASGGALSRIVVAETSYVILSLAGGLYQQLLIQVVDWSR